MFTVTEIRWHYQHRVGTGAAVPIVNKQPKRRFDLMTWRGLVAISNLFKAPVITSLRKDRKMREAGGWGRRGWEEEV